MVNSLCLAHQNSVPLSHQNSVPLSHHVFVPSSQQKDMRAAQLATSGTAYQQRNPKGFPRIGLYAHWLLLVSIWRVGGTQLGERERKSSRQHVPFRCLKSGSKLPSGTQGTAQWYIVLQELVFLP